MKILQIIELAISTIMALVALLHFYWAFGGKKWSEAVIPTKEGNEKAFMPGTVITAAVAVLFLSVSIYFFMLTGFLYFLIPQSVSSIITWIIAGGFILRGIGDFRYFGIFKTIRNTAFAKMDSRYYTPLVLVLGILSIIVITQIS